ATAALRLSVSPRMGIVARTSGAATVSGSRPWASLPIRNAHGPGPRRAGSSPPRTTVAASRCPVSSDTSWMRLRPPSRKCAPAPARSTLGDHGSAVPGPMTTPQPKAAAERTIVPTFPGSLTPISTRRLRSAGGSTQSGMTTIATGRRGVSVAASRSMTRWSTTTTFGHSSRRGSSGRAKVRSISAPAAIASSRTWGPSIRERPVSSLSRERWSRHAATTAGLRGERIGSIERRSVALDAGGLDQSREGSGVVDGEIGQHLAVDLDLGGLEAGDQLGVGGPVLTGRGVDAGDPQPAELALAGPAVAVRIRSRVHDLFVGGAEPAAAGPLVALGLGEDLLVCLAGGDWVPGACHI